MIKYSYHSIDINIEEKMRKYQGLILFHLFITIVCADVKIKFFRTYESDANKPNSGLHDKFAQLWADVAECPQGNCRCNVKVTELADTPQILNFQSASETDTTGWVLILDLQPNKDYSATLECVSGQSTDSRSVSFKTDHGRPLAPENITANLVSGHVEITWSPPSASDDSFTHYEVDIDRKPPVVQVPKNQNSYKKPDAYKNGTEHTIYVKTCYNNNQDKTLCSDPEGKVTFLIPLMATTSPITLSTISAITTATITTKSSNAPIAFISIPTMLLSFFLINQISQ